MNVFSRSWQITKLSFEVMRKDKELILFPILSTIFSILFVSALLVPTVVASILGSTGGVTLKVFDYLMMFLVYLGLAFIATFFNVCVVYTAKKRFAGGNATPSETFKYTFSKIHLIFLWSLLSATVGIILHLLDRMARNTKGIAGMIMQMFVRMLGMGWGIITLFVIPSMVYKELGPINAIKKSVKTLKKTWGESLIRHFGLGLIQMVATIPGLLIAGLLFAIFSSNWIIGLVVAIGFFLIYVIILSMIFNVANTIFNTALYQYAETGKVPMGYDVNTLKGAFKSVKKKGVF